jgi:hypothetical protein
MKDVLMQISNLLNHKIRWAIFGGVAVAIRHGSFHRKFGDIDIIIEDDETKLKQLIPEIKNCDRKGRKKRCTEIDNVKIEFMLMKGENKIDLADKEFEFKKIEWINFNTLKLPTVDSQSLYEAKCRHKESLEQNQKDKYVIKLQKTNKDIKILKKLLNKEF